MTARLTAEGITFGYESDCPLFDEWSIQVETGESVAITGPSGRGKSTLLYLLGLMLRPTQGLIKVDGQRVDNLGDSGRSLVRAHRFGFVFQDAALDPSRTVLDNIVEPVIYRGEDPQRWEKRAGELLDRFGVELPPGRRPTQVSGGQAQRIALCRALLASPEVVLADEPTGNLDPESRDAVVDALTTHAETGAGVVVVTHDASVAQRCTRRIAI